MTILFILFALLQVADGMTTYYSLRKFNREANPLLGLMFKWLGVKAGIVVAKCAASIFGFMLISEPPWILAALSIFYAAVVGINLRALRFL